MILTTYNDWYYDRTAPWDHEDFYEVVRQLPLESDLGPQLFNEDENLINMNSMPFLDLGDKPKTYGPNRPESEQMFVVPKSNVEFVVVKYLQCKASYQRDHKKLTKKFEKSTIPDRGLRFKEFEHAVSLASRY